jgi:tRNA (cmo5U34)-methyltransferase
MTETWIDDDHRTDDHDGGAPETPVGNDIVLSSQNWSFAGNTADHFDEHVAKSVPGYHDGHEVVERLSDFFVAEGGRVIEVGCSTGALTARLARRHVARGASFHGIDIVPEMVRRARERCADIPGVNIELGDAMRIDYTDSTLVVMYYTLQFVPTWRRRELLRRMNSEMRPGGAVILFEKTRQPDARLQDMLNQVYEEYKLSVGFTPDEILNKARSLRGVLEPLTSEQNLELLRESGFTSAWLVHKHLAFEGMLAIKPPV